ncbi:MAG: DUF2157 domain-containing protein [Acidimicrobiales bacterium]|nr:DUF2157 domain-containing protein [Acidimicrobiales bacterium]
MEAKDAVSMWLREGQIDGDLAERLRTSLQAHEEPERANKLIWILVSIGAVLIGGGLLLFIASQWDQSSPTRRLLLLFGIYVLTVAGAALADRQHLGITARGLWFLSSIAVGVNIFLIGQVFNLPLNYWQGTLLWMIATLAMGWASPSSAQGWLAVPLGILTLGWISTPSSQFFDQGAFLWDSGGIRPLLPVIGLGLVALGLLLEATDFAFLRRPSTAFGALLVSGPITVSTFHPDAFAWIFQINLRPFHFMVIVIAVALVAAVWNRSPGSPLVMAFVAVTALLVALLPQVEGGTRTFDAETVSWLADTFRDSELAFGIYTALILGLAVATILAGQHFAVRALVNVGFAMVSVLLVAIYIGRIAGELPTSAAVILGGLLLVGGAIFLERKRREFTTEAKGGVAP